MEKVIRERIEDKIEYIEKYLDELEDIVPLNYEEYLADFKSKAACERYFEKIVEAITDIAFLIIRESNFRTPEDEESSFYILSDEKVIDIVLAKRLKAAKGMRNIVAHKYGDVDDGLVFHAVSGELQNDAKDFIDGVGRFLGGV